MSAVPFQHIGKYSQRHIHRSIGIDIHRQVNVLDCLLVEGPVSPYYSSAVYKDIHLTDFFLDFFVGQCYLLRRGNIDNITLDMPLRGRLHLRANMPEFSLGYVNVSPVDVPNDQI